MIGLKYCVGIIIIATVVSGVAALRCYECVSCNDPFNANNASTTSCLGSCIKTKSDDAVVRTCTPASLGDRCDKQNNNEACSCTADLCNSAPSHGIAFFALFSIFIVLLSWTV